MQSTVPNRAYMEPTPLAALLRSAALRAAAALMVIGAVALPRGQAGTPLEVIVSPRAGVMKASELAFSITLKNNGAEPVLLNAGVTLGNRRQSWAAISCTVQSGTGRRIPLGLHWQLFHVGGRMYPLRLPLRPGDSHVVTVTPADYSQHTPLPTGSVTLQCAFSGARSFVGDDSDWPICRECTATSAAVALELQKSD